MSVVVKTSEWLPKQQLRCSLSSLGVSDRPTGRGHLRHVATCTQRPVAAGSTDAGLNQTLPVETIYAQGSRERIS